MGRSSQKVILHLLRFLPAFGKLFEMSAMALQELLQGLLVAPPPSSNPLLNPPGKGVVLFLNLLHICMRSEFSLDFSRWALLATELCCPPRVVCLETTTQLKSCPFRCQLCAWLLKALHISLLNASLATDKVSNAPSITSVCQPLSPLRRYLCRPSTSHHGDGISRQT